MPTQLSTQGQALLRVLVNHLKSGKVIPDHPETFLGYKEIHDALHLELRGDTYGTSLQHQGLNDLGGWIVDNGFPAVTGLIVDKTTRLPGDGYFQMFGNHRNDFQWWESEIRKSLAFDWSPYL